LMLGDTNMPTFEVRIDGVVIARPSDPAMFGFSASVLTHDHGTSLSVNGQLRSRAGSSSLIEWISRPIPLGCTVEIAYLSAEYDDTPEPSLPELEAEIAENKATAKGIIRSLQDSMGLSHPPSRAPAVSSPRAFEIAVPPADPILALQAAEEGLQAVCTWSRHECGVAVDSITIMPGGSTKGKTYLRQTLNPGQRLVVRNVA
jgi:hypothetical protein